MSGRIRMVLPRAVKFASLILWLSLLAPAAMAQDKQVPDVAPPSQSTPAASPAQPAPAPPAQTAPATTPPPPSAAALRKPEELEALVAPIALYPDNLLSLTLMASTYPLDVVTADRWAKENKKLK